MAGDGSRTIAMNFGQVVRLAELLAELGRHDEVLGLLRDVEPQAARLERTFLGLRSALAELIAEVACDDACASWLEEELVRARVALADSDRIFGEAS